jgi:hypothetical protein
MGIMVPATSQMSTVGYPMAQIRRKSDSDAPEAPRVVPHKVLITDKNEALL